MVNLRMGRKRLGNAAKQRHTITIDPEVVERVSEFGRARGIDGLSGSIERLVRLALISEWILETRTNMIELFLSVRALIMASGLPFEEYPICGHYRTDFRISGRYVFIAFDPPAGERVATMFHRRRRLIVVAPAASASDPRVVDLVGFGALLRRLEKRKPRRDAGVVTKLEKKRRATGKNGSLVAPATR